MSLTAAILENAPAPLPFCRPMPPPFDAQAARALARRIHSAGEILAEMKRAVVEAAARGDFEARVLLADPQLVPAGHANNTADFLIRHFVAHDMPAWAESVQHALQAGYTVTPAWVPLDRGPGCGGVMLAWSMAIDEPNQAPQLMAARDAYLMTETARAQQRWVERACEVVRRAAVKGAWSCTVRDDDAADAEVWAHRRKALEQAGFSTELLAAQSGAQLLIRW